MSYNTADVDVHQERYNSAGSFVRVRGCCAKNFQVFATYKHQKPKFPYLSSRLYLTFTTEQPKTRSRNKCRGIMADISSQNSAQKSFSLNSYQTALAVIPPRHLWNRIDRLRSVYDAAYLKWPPHINVIYPFVRPESLDEAVVQISKALSCYVPLRVGDEDDSDDDTPPSLWFHLNKVGVFRHKGRGNNTIYLCDDNQKHIDGLSHLRREILSVLGKNDDRYTPHMTIAQSEGDVRSAQHKFLFEKVGLVPAVEWRAPELCVLVRERLEGGDGNTTRMRLWGTIGLDGTVQKEQVPQEFYDESEEPSKNSAAKNELLTSLPYFFNDDFNVWLSFRPDLVSPDGPSEVSRSRLTVSSYNVMAEFEWPPSESRYPLLVKNILHPEAEADVLVLQEVTDAFLSYLLASQDLRDAYPYCSHGPPRQDDVDPLPSHLNIVVLSKVPFSWEYVSLSSKHKSALVATFRHVGRRVSEDKILPIVLAALHLSRGLTDAAVASRKEDIHQLLRYVASAYPGHPTILAGDTNIWTSADAINEALKSKNITDTTAATLAELADIFAEHGLNDAWETYHERIGSSGDEDGATWNPNTNKAAAVNGAANGNLCPQRFDRIFVRGEGLLKVEKFNKFGFITEPAENGDEQFASDHWGVRAVLEVNERSTRRVELSEEISKLVVPVEPAQAPQPLSQPGSVEKALIQLGVIPSQEEEATRKQAVDLLRNTITDVIASTVPSGLSRFQAPIVIVPVGSYGLGVWTSSSDLDILCIGPFSTQTFFALVTRALRKVPPQDIKIIRRVRANTGTMLELEIHGIKTDLQYCPATTIAERWGDVLRTAPNDPVWDLSPQSLLKLKAVRDMDYLRRTVPNIRVFRAANRAIRAWAKARGVYTSRFGFLSGIQIAILVARVAKLLANNPDVKTPITVEDFLVTFFTHYASFPWSTHLAFDPFFHRNRLPYNRVPFREPIAILGYFPPALNTAAAASPSSARTLADEFRRAGEALVSGNVTDWAFFLSGTGSNGTTGVQEFLSAYKTYIRLDASYWGLSRSRGSQFLGWLESRLVSLLVDISRRTNGVLHARIWPARFVEREEAGAAEEGQEAERRDFRGMYLIGLDRSSEGVSRDELRSTLGQLRTALERFESAMRKDEKYFDARSCWLGAGLVNKGELPKDLVVDMREWGIWTEGEEDEDEMEEDEEIAQEMKELGLEGSEEEEGVEERVSKKRGKKQAQQKRQESPTAKTGKLRPASDVLSRIRWDPSIDAADYVVGYEDRFIGIIEKPLVAWTNEQTDEEFIPQHRIVYFRRSSDGKKVWDRRERIDEIFGAK